MPLGRCALCQDDGEIRGSHLLPARVYAILRSGTAGEHPVFITPSGSFFSDFEVCEDLLDDKCERRFNERGEDWTLTHCWRSATEFRLRDALQGAVSVEVEPGYHIFAGTAIPGVAMSQLVYFAVSVFWRAAARRWRLDKKLSRRLTFGPSEESLRQFLSQDDEGPLPAGVALLVGVSAIPTDSLNRVADYPALVASSGFRTYRFTIPGLTFVLFVGGQLPPVAASYCASRTGRLFMSPEAEALKLQYFLERVKEAPRRGKLRRTLRT